MQRQRLAVSAFVGVLGVEAAGVGVKISGTEEIHSQIGVELFAGEQLLGLTDQCRVISEQSGFKNAGGGVAFVEADEGAVGVVVVGFLECAGGIRNRTDTA